MSGYYSLTIDYIDDESKVFISDSHDAIMRQYNKHRYDYNASFIYLEAHGFTDGRKNGIVFTDDCKEK